MQQKILFVVPDGTGIKNYLFSDILPVLLTRGVEVIVYHNLPEIAIQEVEQLHAVKLNQQKMSVYNETKKQKFYREAICYARLLHNSKIVDNETILCNWNRNHKGIKKYFYKTIEIYGTYLSKNYERIINAEEKYQHLINTNLSAERTFLNNYQPSSIFCTHQRSLNAIPIVKAANQLGIKTVGAIYSWDNLPKGRLAVKTEEYIVWSDHMKNEMQLYYPELLINKIHVTGTPQFDFYKEEKNSTTKEDFFKNHNLNINKKTICFSGDDLKTSPFDPQYLEALAKSIRTNNGSNKYQILFRRSPVDLTDRYDHVLSKYNDIIIPLAPKWSNTEKQWIHLYPFIEDVKLLTNICKYSDLVVNLGSTMALDFAYFNKPAVYFNYNPIVSKEWSVETVYKFQHFKSMPSKTVVYWFDKENDIFKVVEKAVNNDTGNAKQWLKIINKQDENIVENIVQVIIN